MGHNNGIVTDVEPTVIDIDLRERYDDLLAFGSFTEVQRAFADGLGVKESDLTRVLVIDDARDLEKHTRGIERIVEAPGVDKVVCLAVGPPQDEPARGYSLLVGGDQHIGQQRVVLRKPFALRAPHVTLWTGDARGVGWTMNQTKPTTTTSGDDGTATDGPVLDALIDALRIPKVYDRVYDIVGGLPDGTAAPGLRAILGRADDDVLADAQVRAVDTLLAPQPRGVHDMPDDDIVIEPFRLLLRYPRVASADESVLAEPGEMDGTIKRCRDQMASADYALNVLTSPGAVLQHLGGTGGGRTHAGTIAATVKEVGGLLTTLRDTLAVLFERYDDTHPLGTTARVELSRHGFDLTKPEHMHRTDLLTALRHLVENALERKNPVTEITGWLAWMHDTLVPTGSAARLGDLDQACDENDLRTLREMPRKLAVSLASFWLAVLPVVVCCLIAGLAPGSTTLGIPIALAAVMFVAARGWRLAVARRIGPASHGVEDLVFLILLGLSVVAGGLGMVAVDVDDPTYFVLAQAAVGALAFVGFVVWWAFLVHPYGWTDRSPLDLVFLVVLAIAAGTGGLGLATGGVADPVLYPAAQIAAGLLAVVGLMWWPRALWSRALRRWNPGEYVAMAARRVDDAHDVMVDVVRYDWVLTEARRNAADLVQAMSIAFGDIAEALEAYADRLRGFPASAKRSASAGVDVEVALQLRKKGPDIASIVETDIITLVAMIVEECWPDIEREALDALQTRIITETAAGLDVYGRHLERMGIHAAPPFGEISEQRRSLVDSVWQESRGVSSLLQAAVTDPGILQLCAPEHLQLLNVAPASAKVVRFAPKAAQTPLLRRNTSSSGTHSQTTMPPTVLGELVWTEWGQVAGVLRLARMRPGTVESVLEEGS